MTYRYKVLVVEDDADTLALIRLYLQAAGFDVLTSKNGEEAFLLAMQEEPDLAIIDGLIPGIHGFELCKKIKEEPKLKRKPKIIIMSSVYKSKQYKYEVMEFKADDFLPKPFEKSQLLAKIEAVLKART
ncbi:MAG: response regulator [Nitrospiraceae bacterium]|nr:response regulator [Nitrospiraceae bacterium]